MPKGNDRYYRQRKRLSNKKKDRKVKYKRRPKMRQWYLELHKLDAQSCQSYELHHIVEFSEVKRFHTEGLIDSLGNVLMITKGKHDEISQKRNKIRFYKLCKSKDFPNDKTIYLCGKDKSSNTIKHIELNLSKGDAKLDVELLPYLQSYNQFLLNKLQIEINCEEY